MSVGTEGARMNQINQQLAEIGVDDIPHSYDVSSDEEYRYAGQILTDIKERLKKLEEVRRSYTRPIDEQKAAIMHQFAPAEKTLKEAESSIKNSMNEYHLAQKRAQREEEQRLRREREEEIARARKELLDEGFAPEDVDEAVSELEDAPVTVHREAPKAEGVSYRETWKAEVDDLDALIKAVAEGKAPSAYLTPNMPALTAFARSTKGTAKVPGVRIFKEDTVVARGG